MNRKIKALFLDIDGTFYDHDSNRVLPETIEACKQTQKRGIKVALCSGRPKEMAEDLHVFDLLDWNGYIGATGGVVMNEKYEIIYTDSYTHKQMEALFKIAKEHDVCLISFGKYEFMTKEVDALSKQLIQEFHLKTPVVRTWQQENLTSISALINKEQVHLFAGIEGLKHTSSTKYCVDFIKANVNKANGIKQLMKYWGFNNDEYIAFGDSENDIEMLKQAHIGVAMENGEETLKRSADIVCGPSYETSIADTLKQLKLI
ncbi:MAG: HAD family hydrolase [Erysipelotrichia bacterium]|nr:HAD family hydrolase [Erysipelotrichia bacterium]